MSQHFTFSLSIEIENNLSPEEVAVIEYLFGENSFIPESLPRHYYFEHGIPEKPYLRQYRDFTENSYSATAWLQNNSQNKLVRRFIELRLPSKKIEEIYEISLPFASWLATISCKSGFVGSFSLEDAVDFNPVLLFIYKRELYTGNANEAYSFSTGTKLVLAQ